jgi:hypothetical protein
MLHEAMINFWPWIVNQTRAFFCRAAAQFNQLTSHNAGWPSQFRFAVHGFWSGVCEFHRYE